MKNNNVLCVALLNCFVIFSLSAMDNKSITNDTSKYLIESVTPMGHSHFEIIQKNSDTPLLAYPTKDSPLARAFIGIDYAKVHNIEDDLIQSVYTFKKTLKRGFTIPLNYFRFEFSDQLKEKMLSDYISELSVEHQKQDKINNIISQSIPMFLSQTLSLKQKPSNIKSSELEFLMKADLVTILGYLKQHDSSSESNIRLVYDIVAKTTLSKQGMQACLLLLNKQGDFYPTMQSDLAKITIDDIAKHYLTFQKNKPLEESIDKLSIVPLLEPLLSGTLAIATIDNIKMEDYVDKINELKNNIHLSPAVLEKLNEIEAEIISEASDRLNKAEEAKLEEIKQAEIAKKALDEAAAQKEKEEAKKKEKEEAMVLIEDYYNIEHPKKIKQALMKKIANKKIDTKYLEQHKEKILKIMSEKYYDDLVYVAKLYSPEIRETMLSSDIQPKPSVEPQRKPPLSLTGTDLLKKIELPAENELNSKSEYSSKKDEFLRPSKKPSLWNTIKDSFWNFLDTLWFMHG